MINIALPKGRLGDSVYKSLEKIGYECPEMLSDSRKLVFENSEKGVRYILVKPSDVAVYVEHGVADIGIVGYINGVPRDVLSGGRYDNLMTRFGKKQRALGFAVYIGALTRYFEKKDEFDADLLLIYGDKPVCEVLKAVESHAKEGKKVRAFSVKPENFTARETVIL